MKGKILQKLVAIILIFCMTSANFIFVATDIVYALSTGEITIEKANIKFDAYFKQDEKKAYTKSGTISKGETLYLSITMPETGVLENAKIKIDNANFKILKDKVSNNYVSSINETTNEIQLNKITNGESVVIELPIAFEKSDVMNTTYFDMENKYTLSGTYKDSSEIEVTGEIYTELLWNDEVKTSYSTDIEKVIFNEDRTLIQTKIISEVENNTMPKTTETVEITSPKIDDKYASSVYVFANGTKISDTEINNDYNLTSGTLSFEVSYLTDNNITWKTGTDEYTVIFIYDQPYVDEDKDISVTPKISTQIYAHEKVLSGSPNKSISGISTNKGTIVSMTATGDDSEIYKGYMYSNSEETSYTETYNIEISDKENIDSVSMEFVEDNFKTETDETISTNEKTLYKQIIINKENMKNILGTDGTITIEQDDGSIITIDSSSKEEDGNIVQTVETHGITIKTSKPEQEGILEITAQKAIQGNADLSKEQIKTINGIATKLKAYSSNSEETSETEIETALLETTTEASLVMENEGRGNILSAKEENENVEFTVTLKTGTIDADLYKSPTVTLILPQDVTETSINSVSALYDESELTIESSEVGQTDEGLKTITVKLSGEQITYDNKLIDGIKLTINAKVKLDELSTDKTDKIEMKYTNENATEKEYSTSIDVDIESRSGLILRNTLTANGNTQKTFEEEVLSQTINAGEEQTVTVDIAMVNNYDKTIDNVSIIGRIPAEDTQDSAFDETLKSTFATTLKDGIEAQGGTVLYSQDIEAKADSDSWTESSENAKSYKIVLDENKLDVGGKVLINYDIKIPSDISYNQSTYQKLDISYTYDGQTYTKTAASSLSTELRDSTEIEAEAEGTTESIDGIDVNIKAISGGEELKDGDEVYEGQTIKYVITITNNKDEDLTNLKLNVNHENANIFEDETIEQDYTAYPGEKIQFTYVREQDGKNSKEFSLSSLPAGKTGKLTYQIRVSEDIEELKNTFKLSGDNIEEKEVSTTNKVKTAELKLEITNNESKEYSLHYKKVFTNELEITNISEQQLENIEVEFEIPEEFKLYETPEEEGCTIESADSIIKIKIDKIDSSKSKTIDIPLQMIEDNPSRDTATLQYLAKVNGNTYFSNELDVGMTAELTSEFEITQTGSIEEDTVTTGDKLTYITTIKNVGNTADTIIFTDNVPEATVVTSAYYEINGNQTQIEDVDDNCIVANISIGTDEEAKVYIETQVDESVTGKEEITNTSSIVGNYLSESLTSNEITYKLASNITSNASENEEISEEGVENIEDESNGQDEENQNNNEEEQNNNNGTSTGSESSNEENNSTVIVKNSISGLAWIDEDKDGIRDSSEKLLEGITVSLANTQTGKYVSDESGNKLEVKTDANGTYKFEDIEQGKYIVVFTYDNVKYRNTEYQAKSATESTNSDIITSKVSINDDSTWYAVTDTLEISGTNLTNVDAGFIENEIFDLSLNKYVSKVTIQNSSGTVVKQYDKEQLAKAEIDSKQIASSTVLIEYELQITNEGELAGYANEIVDYMPTDLTFSSEINTDWYKSTDGNLHSTALSKELIEPGETKTITLTLVKTMTENNVGLTSNKAEIAKSSNDLSIPDTDSTAGNNKQGEDDISTAEVLISIKTGLAFTISVISIIIAIAIVGTVVYMKKRGGKEHE